MKKLRKLFKTAFQHIGRNPYHALAVVLVMTQTFLVIALLSFVLAGSEKIINYVESKAQISAYFTKEINSEDQIKDIRESLLATGKIASIRYISKEEALNIFKKQENNPQLTDFITADTLPASYDINTKDPSDLYDIENILKNDTRVEKIQLLKEAIDNLTKVASIVRNAGLVSTSILLTTSLLIILIVISLNISVHKDEIEIMKLVGANSNYVRLPFIIEGITYGLISALVAWGLSWGLIVYATPFLSSFFEGIPLFPIPLELIGSILGVEMLIGILLGLIGSVVATYKYLKV